VLITVSSGNYCSLGLCIDAQRNHSFLCVCVQGTSADQDTRFSNKQAKLMKSQKFAPELEHLVRFLLLWLDIRLFLSNA
jgi:hypothetical protein